MKGPNKTLKFVPSLRASTRPPSAAVYLSVSLYRIRKIAMITKISEVGYWSGLVAFAAVVSYDVVQILQVVGVLKFPIDEILIYGISYA